VVPGDLGFEDLWSESVNCNFSSSAENDAQYSR
jgi:hypothetical protein